VVAEVTLVAVLPVAVVTRVMYVEKAPPEEVAWSTVTVRVGAVPEELVTWRCPTPPGFPVHQDFLCSLGPQLCLKR
jgi:hypothetical protein